MKYIHKFYEHLQNKLTDNKTDSPVTSRSYFTHFYPQSLCQAAEIGCVRTLSKCEVTPPLVSGRKIAAAAAAETVEFGTPYYFFLCGLGGMTACGFTHLIIVPLDLVKCRIQVEPAKYKNIGQGFKLSLKEEGAKGLVKGWAPTLIGYSCQGFGKFGFYEIFKVWYASLIGEENAYLYRTYMFLCASASAEFFADISLAPFEAIKVKIQTTKGYASTMREAIPKMLADEGSGVFIRSLVPLWMRQIPYTMSKFTSFERIVEVLYRDVLKKPRAKCTQAEQLVVTFSGGYIAGVFCAVVSHPADTVVSKMSRSKGSSAFQIAKEVGMMGLMKGLTPRIIMIGTLTALQWFIYDSFKVAFGMPRPNTDMPESLRKKLAAQGKG